jgi:hypothetical protein
MLTSMAIRFRGGTNEMTSIDAGSDQPWTSGTWSDGDHANTARWRSGLRVPDRMRPMMIMVKLGFPSRRLDGQPTREEWDGLEVVERTVIRELAAHDAAVVLVMTGYWAREIVAYGSSTQFLKEWGPTALHRWSADYPDFGVEAALDPRWKTFKRHTA